MLNISETVWDT